MKIKNLKRTHHFNASLQTLKGLQLDVVDPGGGQNSPNFAWLGLYCTVNFVEKCFLMTELVS